MANIQSISDLENDSGLVSFGHPPVNLRFETAANKTVVTRWNLRKESRDRATRIQLCKTHHNRYHPKSVWNQIKPARQPPTQSTTFLELLASYWDPPHTWDQPAITTFDRIFGISELGNAILSNLIRRELTRCLETSRTLRHTVQLSSAAQLHLATLPFKPADELYDNDTCCIPFAHGLTCPILITKDVVLPPKQEWDEIIKQPKHRIFVDIRFRRYGHDPHDSDIVGSWADMKLPDMPPSLLSWEIWVDCDCRYIEQDLHGDRGAFTPAAATTLWSHRLTTHDKPLREIAECAREVFKAHEHCVPQNRTSDVCVSFKCSAPAKVNEEGVIVRSREQ
ncbi:hypothetical protein KCU71_g18527, partial [Aureobasidium melanogenum]